MKDLDVIQATMSAEQETNAKYKDTLGVLICDCVFDQDNCSSDIGKHVFNTIMECKTQRDLEIVDHMLTSITGWCLESLLDLMDEDVEDTDDDEFAEFYQQIGKEYL